MRKLLWFQAIMFFPCVFAMFITVESLQYFILFFFVAVRLAGFACYDFLNFCCIESTNWSYLYL